MIKSWSDTLSSFLKSSNEDEAIHRTFTTNVLPTLLNVNDLKSLKWLEIGIGDGNKTRLFSKSIDEACFFDKVNLTICEPSIDWLVYLQSNNFTKSIPNNFDANFINFSIEEYVDCRIVNDYDFISIVQVMYSDSIKNAVLKLIDDTPKGNSCVYWIDVEDKSGDFYKMRAELAKFKKSEVNSMTDKFLEDLSERNIQYKTFYTVNKTCSINKSEILSNDNHWIFPFIIGSSYNEFDGLKVLEKSLIRNTVRNYISTLQTELLNIPDISILFTINKK